MPFGKLIRRMHHLLHRRRLEREFEEELAAHREMMEPERRRAFGNALQFQDESRDLWGWLWLDHLRQDLAFAARGFSRDRRFTLSALAAIVLAVGAATAVFSVVDRSLFRPLPYREGDRLVSVGIRMPVLGEGEIMWAGAYRHWRVSQNAVDLTSWGGVTQCDLGGDHPQRLNCARAEATFLPTLGVQPVLGRVFSDQEDQRGAAPVVLLSWRMWRTNYGADRDVLGKTIVLDGTPARIIGVLPENFETPNLAPTDLLVLQQLPRGPNTNNYEVTVIGRLRPGQTAASAAAALAAPFERFRKDFGARVGSEFERSMSLHVEPVRDGQIRRYRLALWVLLGGVAAFVLIACANVANLLLARSAVRRQEFAIRAALGGSRGRLTSQLLTESGLLGICGGAAGCALAWILLRVFTVIAPDGTLRMKDAAIDARVLAFALALSAGTALVFGLFPALQRLRVEVLGGDRATGPRRAWMRQTLISSQLAISLVLLAGAGLLLVSLWRLESIPTGFSRQRVLTATFTLPAYRYGQDLHPTGWSTRQFSFFNELAERMKQMPGAIATAITDSVPPGAPPRSVPYLAFANPAGRATDPGMSGRIKWRYISTGYFEVLGIQIRRGRSFSEEDQSDAGQRRILVNESLARRMFGDKDPIGKRLGANLVIGVAADVKNAGLDRTAEPEFYMLRKSTGDSIPGSSDPEWWRRATVVVRSNLGERDAEGVLKAVIGQVDPTVPVEVKTMEAQVDTFLTGPRFETSLLVLFACTGLVLAGIGLYGLILFLVEERTREIGLRIALGATPGQVARQVASAGVRWTMVGAIAGIAGAASLLRVLKGLLYGVEVVDLRVFAGAVSVLIAVAILAAWMPARRAARIDPMVALRHD